MAPHACMVFKQEPHAFLEALRLIPGVKWRKKRWEVPYNAVEVVANLMQQHGVEALAANWVSKPGGSTSWEVIEAKLLAKGEVYPWVLNSFILPYQKDAVSFGWSKSGMHYWIPPGSGKTLIGILVSLSVSGLVIVVTRACSRIQYAREIERFVKTRAFVIRPASEPTPVRVQGESYHQWRGRHKGNFDRTSLKKAWQEHKARYGIDRVKGIEEYLEECKENKTRPFIVVGWESLSDNLQMLMSLYPSAVIYDELHRGKSVKRFEVIHLADLPDDPVKAAAIVKEQEREARKKDGFIKEVEEGLTTARKMFVPLPNTATSAAYLSRVTGKRVSSTATPIKDRVRDLWSQLDIIEPNSWGGSSAWRFRYAGMHPGVFGGMDDRGSSNLPELNLRLKNIAFRLSQKQTHAHLPPKRRQSIYISPSDQCRPSAGFTKELREAKKRGATAVVECRLAEAASMKRTAVMELLEEHLAAGEKIVVFTGRRKDCDELGATVEKLQLVKKENIQVWAAHGDTPADVRQGIVDEYMAHPGPCCLVGTGYAFGESLNLDTSNAAFFVMLPYDAGSLKQWEGRFHRASTKQPVVIYYIVAEGTIDEHMVEILMSKIPAIEEVSQDDDMAGVKGALTGENADETPEEFAASILAMLDE